MEELTSRRARVNRVFSFRAKVQRIRVLFLSTMKGRPRTKGSTGYPDSVKDLPFFSDPHYQGVGFRWEWGSIVRVCD